MKAQPVKNLTANWKRGLPINNPPIKPPYREDMLEVADMIKPEHQDQWINEAESCPTRPPKPKRKTKMKTHTTVENLESEPKPHTPWNNPTRPPEQHSPLPWSTTEQGLFIRGGGQRICTMATREPCTRDEHATREANAAYIVKAANEYPKLVAQCDELLAALKGLMQCFVWDVEKTVAQLGTSALQSDVKRAYEAIAKCEAQP